MKIETLLQDYRPSSEAVDTLQSVSIVLLVGIVSAGKDTIQGKLLEKNDYTSIVTCTTRQPRENNGVLEQDGVDYHYLTLEQMTDNITNHRMIEVNKFGDNFYGTHVNEFKKASQTNKIVLGDIDVNGIAAFRKLAPDAVTALFIVPPTYEAWQSRLEKRYSSREVFNVEWKKRRDLTINELRHALEVPYYHFIINDDLDRAVRVIDEIAHRGDAFNRHDDEARLAARDLLDAITNAG